MRQLNDKIIDSIETLCVNFVILNIIVVIVYFAVALILWDLGVQRVFTDNIIYIERAIFVISILIGKYFYEHEVDEILDCNSKPCKEDET